MDNIIDKVKTPLTGIDLMNAFNNKVNIFPYSKIHTFNNIDEILGKYKRVILLYQTSLNFGHWCCLYEYCGSICFFDSYGFIPDDELKFTPKDLKKELKQEYRYLTKLLYESGKPIQYNEYKLQIENDNINTCGRWCIIRLKYPKISIDNFYKIFNSFKPIKPDFIISLIT